MNSNIIESNVMKYTGIKSISGFTCVVNRENETSYYDKEFRYSSDKILWSDYQPLTNKNLSSVKIYDNTVYIQYKFKQVGENNLSVENISLDVDYVRDETVIPECFWNKSSSTPQIVFNQGTGSNLFNPYAIGQSYDIYQQMSTLVSNMFGICVLYFKTEPNSKSRDVVLKEYSIEKVIDKQNVKILIPDNQLPTRELNFNQLMIDYNIQFEINIVKSEFWKVFGEGSHPDPHDYLYFSQYMNKMYMVDSVSDPDDFGSVASYWRVSIVPYQEMKSVQFNNDNLMEDTESLIFSAEGKFEDEMNVEVADNRKDNQLNNIGDLAQGQDGIRRILHENVRIVEENIYNDWTVVAKQYYNLSTIDKGDIAVEYKTGGLSSEDEMMFTFAFRPTNMNNVSENIMVDYIIDNNGRVRLKMKSWDKLLEKGNMVKISRIMGLNGWHKITNVEKGKMFIDIDVDYSDTFKVQSCGKVISYETNSCVYGGDNFEIIQMPDKMVVKIDGTDYDYVFDGFSSFEAKWYFCVLGIKRGFSNMWLYEVKGSETLNNTHSEIIKIGCVPKDLGTFKMSGYCGLKGCNLHLTNFRLWSKLCEEDLHKLILSQYVVDDTHNTLIVDNAQNELLVNYKWS
jgi:hypothetical protein